MINYITSFAPSLAQTLMITQSIIFILLWLSLHRYILSHGPITGFSTVITLNSRFYSTASFALFILMLSSYHDSLARRLYHASKFYEYVDILNVLAAGGSIDLHFGFHHLTTPYLTFFRVVQHSNGWKPFAVLNTFHHVLLYAFFGGVGRLRPVLPWTGYLQLIIGIVVEGWLVRKNIGSPETQIWPHYLAGLIMTFYIVLFTRDLAIRNREEKVKAKEK